jgi:hypothetical protein
VLVVRDDRVVETLGIHWRAASNAHEYQGQSFSPATIRGQAGPGRDDCAPALLGPIRPAQVPLVPPLLRRVAQRDMMDA